MVKKKPEPENNIELAYEHIIKETGLNNVMPSLEDNFPSLRKAHDSIHEFTLIAPFLFPFQTDKKISWYERSAFLLYHHEVFDVAHRSFLEALCGYYGTAFTLLRVVLELIIKGAFWECLAHKHFREDSSVLDRDKQGKNIKNWLNEIFKRAPSVQKDVEKISGAIYDKISPIVDQPEFRPPVKTIIRQLCKWEIFCSIPNPVDLIYNKLYGKLSANVHVVPDMTDVGGRLLLEPTELFSSGKILKSRLSEHTRLLREVMDIGIVVELNIMKDQIKEYEQVRKKLHGELEPLDRMELEHSAKRMRQLVIGERRNSGEK